MSYRRSLKYFVLFSVKQPTLKPNCSAQLKLSKGSFEEGRKVFPLDKIAFDIFSLEKSSWYNFYLEKNSFWLFSYGKKFQWKFFLWKKIPVGILPLEKSSCWNCFFGKKLQCYICIGINFSCRKKVWKKVPSFTFIILSVVLGIEPGIKFPCKAFLWKKIHIWIKTFGKNFLFLGICTFGNYFCQKKFLWK